VFLTASTFGVYSPIVWGLLAAAGIVGLIALASPALFSKLAAVGNRWVDTSGFLAKLDRRVEVDSRVMPYSRALGAAVVASVAMLAFVLYGR